MSASDDTSFTFSLSVSGGGSIPSQVTFYWGTADGGPYVSNKTVNWATSIVLTDVSFDAGVTYFFVAKGLNPPNCLSVSNSNQEVGTLLYHPDVETWRALVTTNSGVAPTSDQKFAANVYVKGMVSASLWADVLFCGIFCPTITNVTTALTPLKKGPGAGLWTTNVSLNGQANDVKGLHGDPGNNVSISTGLMPSAVWSSDDDAGVSMIIPDFNGSANPAGIEFGGYGPDNVKDIFIAAKSSGNSSGAIWDGVHSVAVVASPGVGYYAINRLASNDLKMFYGKAGTPVAQLGATQTAPGGGRWSQAGFDLRILSIGFGGSTTATSSSYVSLILGHKGWTLAKEQTSLDLGNALRTALGGGNV